MRGSSSDGRVQQAGGTGRGGVPFYVQVEKGRVYIGRAGKVGAAEGGHTQIHKYIGMVLDYNWDSNR